MSTPASLRPLAPTAPARARPALRRVVGVAALVVLVAIGGVLAAMDPFTSVFYWSNAIVGAFLIARRPRMRIAWAVLFVAFGYILTTTPPDLDLEALQAGTASWRDFLWLWAGQWGGSATFLGYLALALLFPTDRLLPGRLGALGGAVLVASLALMPLVAMLPVLRVDVFPADATTPTQVEIANRFGLPLPQPVAEALGALGFLVPLAGLLAVGSATLRARYRSGDATTRLQLRGFTAAMLGLVGAVLFGLAVSLATANAAGIVAWLPAMVAYPAVPASIVVAVTRHRLWDIDRIISRTLAYALLTASLAAVFVAIVVGVQALLVGVTRADGLPIAVSTLAVFALFQPLRRRIQRIVDRRFNRSRVDAERTVSAFGVRLRDQLDLPTLSADLEAAASVAVEPTRAAVWLTTGPRRT